MDSHRIKRQKTGHINEASTKQSTVVPTRAISIRSEEESNLDDDTEDSEVDDIPTINGHARSIDETRVSTQDSTKTANAVNPITVKPVPVRSNARVIPQSKEDSLREATTTSGLYKSNVFKLQVDELLQNVKPRSTGRQQRYAQHFDRLKAAIQALPSRQPLSVQESIRSLEKSKTYVPFPSPQPEPTSNYKFEYAPPSRVVMIGSESVGLSTRETTGQLIDVLVEMPSTIFQEKDILNHRYFYRRAYYLAVVAVGLRKAEPTFEYQYDLLHGNELLPVLVVTPKQDGEKSKSRTFSFRILAGLAEDQFSAEKLSPAIDCINPSVATTSKSKSTVVSSSYNASIRQDSLYQSFENLRVQTMETCEAYKDTCLLGTVWLRQRGFDSRIENGGFGSFEWSILLALLLQGGGPRDTSIFSPRYSSFQLFKAALQFLATRDLVKSPLGVLGSLPKLPRDNSAPYLFDAQRTINLLYKMTPWSYKALQLDAKATLAALSDTKFDHFTATFIARTDVPLLKYDFILNLLVSSVIEASPKNTTHWAVEQRYRDIYDIFTRAATDRVRLINVKRPIRPSWNLDQKPFGVSEESRISFEMVFEPANAQRKIDHGPSAESKVEASRFRKFWGEKAELRRFADGSILETLVWSGKIPGKSVFQEVIEYVVATHLGAAAAVSATYVGGHESGSFKGNTGKGAQGHAAFSGIRDAFRRLGEDLRALEALPLQVRQIMPADAQLTSTSVQIPLHAGLPMTTPANVLLQFEGSGRWPDDLAAIERTKTAFLLKVAELMEAHVDGLQARVGLENQHRSYMNESFVDIAYPSGAAFRLRILHDREQTLRERRLKLPSNTQQEKMDVAQGFAAYKRHFVREPAHVQAMQSACSRFEALSTSVRLLKTWFASHLLSPYFSSAVIEMVAVRCFLDPAPWLIPSSPVSAFLRTLVLLSKWDWRTVPWIVVFGNNPEENAAPQDVETDTRADVGSIRTKFEAVRKLDPRLDRWVLFVASDLDPDGTTWTDQALPPKVVAARMTQLARAAVANVNTNGAAADLQALFQPDMQDYDLIIYLRPQKSRSNKNGNEKQGAFKNLRMQQEASAAREDLGARSNAALFFNDLQSSFGDALIFFFDGESEKYITAIWDPSLESRSWKAKADCSTVPIENKVSRTLDKEAAPAAKTSVLTKPNKAGIINEITRLGGDLIKSIEAKPV